MTTSLERTFEHNRWATAHVLDGLADAPAGFMDREARPGGGTNREKLQHMALVERGFHDVIVGKMERPAAPDDVAGLARYCEDTAAMYQALLASPLDLEQQVHIPWWERSFTIGDCLSQVLSHTAQHRAEIAWELARENIDTGEVDYIVWFDQEHPA